MRAAWPSRPCRRPSPRRADRQLDRFSRILASNLGESFVEPAGMRLLGLGQRLEPLRELAEAFAARRLGHARVHLRVLVGLAGDRRLEIFLGLADGLAGGRIAY